jgi:RNA polymerase sigma-70 factor (ECF subfamily)
MRPDADGMNQQKFDELYDTHRTAVYCFAFSLTRDRGEAEDLFQETWLRVAQYFPKVLDMKKVKSWLFTITANLHKDALRRKRTRRRFLFQKKWTADQDLNLNEDYQERLGRDYANEADKVEMGHVIYRAISSLPDQYRLVFMLKEVAGFKQSEISEILGIPIGTVKSLMFRAVKRLRMDLAVYHPEMIKNNRRRPNEL